MKEETLQQVIDAIINSDRAEAIDLIVNWGEEHGYLSAVSDILEPTLLSINADYEAGKPVSLAHGYIIAKVAEETFRRAAASPEENAGAPVSKGAVVIGNIEDDYHALGRKMVGSFLRVSGWDVHDLGNDVLAKDFVEAALKVDAKVIGVSAMMQTTALNIAQVREEIDSRGLKGRLQLAVGGAVFILRPALVEQVGGDGTARNALLAPKLFSELRDHASAQET